MSELTDKARQMAKIAAETRSNDHAVSCLVVAIDALCDELEAHQHTYYAHAGLGAQPYVTAPQRTIVNPNEKIFEEQAAAKLAAKRQS